MGLKERFKSLAETLSANERKIVDELNAEQGKSIDIGGYYLPDPTLTQAAMCPCQTFNKALAAL